MSTPVLATKLYIPPPRPNIVLRHRLIERLNNGLYHNQGFARKLTLISAPAGFGKTTLVSEWVNPKAEGGRTVPSEVEEMEDEDILFPPSRVAWLALDQGDNDPARFLTYLVAALQIIEPKIGEGVLGVLQSPQPPPVESILITLLNEITTIPDNFILVLDDYHLIDAPPVHNALAFLLDHLPPQMHLVIATREEPQLPLPRYRVRGQMTELRAADLRFTADEAATFLNQVMGLNLSTEDTDALETRTEGWIAGLQLAALSMQSLQDTTSFIKSFTGSHHFVMDYLVQEVLRQQPESVQMFLLYTSILDRLCGPLCDAVCSARTASSAGTAIAKDESGRTVLSEVEGMKDEENSSSSILEYLQRANMFIVPLDNERRWYRYHHLFAELLRQRLHHHIASSTEDRKENIAELHSRASRWYEDNGLVLEAFHHAVAANDIEHAERLIEKNGIHLHFRGTVSTVLNWLASLPTAELDMRPSLWATYASLLLVTGQTTGVEEKLKAVETALAAASLPDTEPDDKTRNLIGQIAVARATLALTQYQVETMITQSRRALEYLPPDNLPFRTSAIWNLGVAYQFQGDRIAASRAYTEAISTSQTSGDIFHTILATTGLGQIQELENQLFPAAETYQRGLQLIGEQPLPIASEVHLGLARIFYQWNNLAAAQEHGQQSLQLARQYDNVIDRFIISEVFLARLKLAQGDVAAAAAVLAEADKIVHRHNFVQRMVEVATAQVPVLIRQGDLATAAYLAEEHDLPLSLARVYLAQGDTGKALALLEPLRQQMEARNWQDERLKVMVLQAVTLYGHGDKDKAVELLSEALTLAEPGGFIRIFVDEGPPMAELLERMAPYDVRAEGGGMRGYIQKLQTAFEGQNFFHPSSFSPQPLIEPLSQRELEILQLIDQGLSNREISERLFLALSTVKTHNRNIFGKLEVQRRTEAVSRARELGLL